MHNSWPTMHFHRLNWITIFRWNGVTNKPFLDFGSYHSGEGFLVHFSSYINLISWFGNTVYYWAWLRYFCRILRSWNTIFFNKEDKLYYYTSLQLNWLNHLSTVVKTFDHQKRSGSLTDMQAEREEVSRSSTESCFSKGIDWLFSEVIDSTHCSSLHRTEVLRCLVYTLVIANMCLATMIYYKVAWNCRVVSTTLVCWRFLQMLKHRAEKSTECLIITPKQTQLYRTPPWKCYLGLNVDSVHLHLTDAKLCMPLHSSEQTETPRSGDPETG